jgi:UDP-N-acetylglucosamine 1-carboxyvinyltransferase
MGADIKVETQCLGEINCRFKEKNYHHSAIINGVKKLRASNLMVRDLRSGIAHVIAALTADGESAIDGIEEIDRGYERIDERLKNLGAIIKRIN